MAVLTRDDMINIETGIVLAEMLGKKTATRVHWTDTPLVLRVYDRALGFAVAQRFGFENVRSTVELAAPWFIGAAIGLQVLGTFSVGQSSFVVGGMQVAAGSELDGLRMFELSTQTRVIAIITSNGLVKLHPRRDARLHADDTVYLVGPYRELIDTLRGGDRPAPTRHRRREQARSEDRLNSHGSSNGSWTPGVRQALGAGAFGGDLADRFAHEFFERLDVLLEFADHVDELHPGARHRCRHPGLSPKRLLHSRFRAHGRAPPPGNRSC